MQKYAKTVFTLLSEIKTSDEQIEIWIKISNSPLATACHDAFSHTKTDILRTDVEVMKQYSRAVPKRGHQHADNCKLQQHKQYLNLLSFILRHYWVLARLQSCTGRRFSVNTWAKCFPVFLLWLLHYHCTQITQVSKIQPTPYYQNASGLTVIKYE